MDDLISRQAAIDAFDGVKVDEDYCDEYAMGYNDGIDFAVSKLSVLPSSHTERKKGRWIYYPTASGSTSTAVYFYPVCSECGREHPIANYCPNCGAKMEGEQDE